MRISAKQMKAAIAALNADADLLSCLVGLPDNTYPSLAHQNALDCALFRTYRAKRVV